MDRKITLTASFFGIIAIVLGAFGAHALKKVLPVEALTSFETGVRYQFYHTFFLLFIGTTSLLTEKAKKTVYYFTVGGILLFSGSIYLLATKELTNIDFKQIGILTPIGGFLLIIAWTILMLNILNKRA